MEVMLMHARPGAARIDLSDKSLNFQLDYVYQICVVELLNRDNVVVSHQAEEQGNRIQGLRLCIPLALFASH
jgi:hypothetical protein